MTTKTFGVIAPSLKSAGYNVIPVTGKRPLIPNWQNGLTAQQVSRYAANGHASSNVGLLAKTFPGIDIDVRDEACAQAIEALALRMLGTAPIRVGTAPKRLLMYTTESPFTKVKVFLEGPNGPRDENDKDYAVEILGDGQQYVIYGRHPDGHDYHWPNNDGPETTDIWDLTPITIDDINKFIEAIPSYLPDGWRVRESGSGREVITGDAAETALANYRPPLKEWDLDSFSSEVLPHLDPDCSYEEWIRIGAAMHHQGQGGEDWLEAFDSWSSGSGKYVEGLCAQKWDSFHNQRGQGVITIRSLLAKTAEARKVVKPKLRSGFKLVAAAELITQSSRVAYLVAGVMESGALGALIGDTGTYKSFIAISLCASIATGSPWFGRKTEQGAAIVIAGEGHGGFGRRLEAWEIHSGISLAQAPFYFSNIPASLTDTLSMQHVSKEVDRIVATKGPPKIIVIDTLHRNFGDGDENQAGDMAKVLANLDSMRAQYGCTVLLIHHVGHNAQDRGRGSSSFRAAMDFEYLVTRTNSGNVTIESKKSKDAAPPEPLAFTPHTVELPESDEEGEPLKSIVMLPTDALSSKKRKRLSGACKIAFESLQRLLADRVATDFLKSDDASGIPIDDWRNAAIASGISDSTKGESKHKAFGRARKALMDQGLVRCVDERYLLSP